MRNRRRKNRDRSRLGLWHRDAARRRRGGGWRRVRRRASRDEQRSRSQTAKGSSRPGSMVHDPDGKHLAGAHHPGGWSHSCHLTSPLLEISRLAASVSLATTKPRGSSNHPRSQRTRLQRRHRTRAREVILDPRLAWTKRTPTPEGANAYTSRCTLLLAPAIASGAPTAGSSASAPATSPNSSSFAYRKRFAYRLEHVALDEPLVDTSASS